MLSDELVILYCMLFRELNRNVEIPFPHTKHLFLFHALLKEYGGYSKTGIYFKQWVVDGLKEDGKQ